jgi:hypothetical protein
MQARAQSDNGDNSAAKTELADYILNQHQNQQR